MECYHAVKEDPEKVIAALKRVQNDEMTYYRVRNSNPRSAHGRAARLIYLCRLSFNGIYRENKNGAFNVPYGHKTHLEVSQDNVLKAASSYLQRAELRCCDFAEATADAKSGDVIYFDPPYTVAHDNNGFVKYNRILFSWSDQERLAAEASRLATIGCRVLVSNAHHKSVKDLYPGFNRITIRRASVIAASARYRREISEALFVNF